MDGLNKLLELLTHSAGLGFALFFAGAVIFTGQRFGLLPFELAAEHQTYILYGMLVGAGLVFLRLMSWLKEGSSSVWTGITELRQKWTVMNRVNELTPPQQAALMWIAQNPGENISGNRYDEPFNALIDRQYLFASDDTTRPQGFRVNGRVFSKKDKLAAAIPKEVVSATEKGMEAPWKQRNRRI
jgi:hypothetical protein